MMSIRMSLPKGLNSTQKLINISFLLQFFFLDISFGQVDFYEADCAKFKPGNTTGVFFFPRAFSVISEMTQRGLFDSGLTVYMLSSVQFSEPEGQMSMESEFQNNSFTAFMDSKLNVCLLRHLRNGQCIMTERPCLTIGQISENVEIIQDKLSLKSPEESLWLRPIQLVSAVKHSLEKTRGIDSVVYVTCQKDEKTESFLFSQWHFLNTSTFPVKDDMSVALMVRHDIVNKNGSFTRSLQIDHTEFKQIHSDGVRTNLNQLHSNCISENALHVTKRIPTPPKSFSCAKETVVSRTGGIIERVRDVETIYYNYDALWFQYNTYLTYKLVNNTAGTEIVKVTEDFNTKERYEVSNTGSWCETFPDLSRAGRFESHGTLRMKSPTEFWNINPDAAVFMGKADIRGFPCDAWRIGPSRSDSNESNKTYTIFLANKKWLRWRRLPEHTFLPIEYIEESESVVRYFSYFGFKQNYATYVPDISPCFKAGHSVDLSLTLLTSFHQNIKNYPSRFELNFRNTVMQLAGLVSSLRVTKIRARPSILDPFQTRVTFKIISRTWTFSNVSDSKEEDTSVSEAVAKLKNAVTSGKFVFNQMVNYEEITIRAEPKSLSNPKDTALDGLRDNDEAIPSTGYSLGLLIGLCILMFVVGGVLGFGIIYRYKLWSDKEIQDLVQSSKPKFPAPAKAFPFGVLEISES